MGSLWVLRSALHGQRPLIYGLVVRSRPARSGGGRAGGGEDQGHGLEAGAMQISRGKTNATDLHRPSF